MQPLLFLRETFCSSEHFEDGHLNKSENPNLGPFSIGNLFSPNDVGIPFTFQKHQTPFVEFAQRDSLAYHFTHVCI